MRNHQALTRSAVLLAFTLLGFPGAVIRAADTSSFVPNLAGFANPTGVARTVSATGGIDLTGPFFQDLGTNGRSCATCHQPSDAMSVSAAHVQARFEATQGLDPIFRTNDGSNCDHDIDVSSPAGRSAAYSLLRTRGLIRVSLPVPANADFEVVRVDNPYGCNETGTISVYRRPLPATNLRFLSTVMWDGRESSAQTGTAAITSASYPQSLIDDLLHQAVDATLGHAQASQPPTPAQQQAIVALELGLTSAQAEDQAAGNLWALNAGGGPENLVLQPFFIGINDPVGLNPMGAAFTSAVFNLFDSWKDDRNPRRASISRGQAIFNTRAFTISGVGGLNGATFVNPATKSRVTVPGSIVSTCGVCHDSPNAGNHSVAAPLDIGIATGDDATVNPLNLDYLPKITLRSLRGHQTVTTTDPGRALITGKFDDIGRFKGPVLRSLAARAPYFHNGAAQTLLDVVTFYDVRFNIGLSAQEKADLAAFLSSL